MHLKLAILGAMGVTISTVVPLSVIKGSEAKENFIKVEQQVESSLSGSSDVSHQLRGSENSGSPKLPKEQQTLDKKIAQFEDCKEVARSREGKLNVCYVKQNDKEVKFTFIEFLDSLSGSVVENSSYDVGSLFSFISPNTLIVEVLKIDNVGRDNRRVLLDLPQEAFSDKSSFSFKNKQIDRDKCVVDWRTYENTRERIDWKVTC